MIELIETLIIESHIFTLRMILKIHISSQDKLSMKNNTLCRDFIKINKIKQTKIHRNNPILFYQQILLFNHQD